ncbi:hypothetical protein [Novosphingobium sp.]|uniref:hypothetical protein n=1 Tax=Novosphingobium sp. TaxID=1874826 RepID=UPI0033424F01
MALPVAAMAEEPPSLALYGHLPGFEMAAISPSGDHIAVLATIDGARLVLVLDPRLQATFQTPIGADTKIRGLDWAGDQAVLIDYSRTVNLGDGFTTDKAELGSVLVLPLDGSKPWNVFAKDADMAGGVVGIYGVVRKNGHWVGYFGGITLANDLMNIDRRLVTANPDLYEVDLQTRKHHIVAYHTDGDHNWRSWLIDDKGAIGAVFDRDSDHGGWTLTTGNGQKLASGTDLVGNVSLIGFSPDGAGVVYGVRDAASATDNWFTVPLAGARRSPGLTGWRSIACFRTAATA